MSLWDNRELERYFSWQFNLVLIFTVLNLFTVFKFKENLIATADYWHDYQICAYFLNTLAVGKECRTDVDYQPVMVDEGTEQDSENSLLT